MVSNPPQLSSRSTAGPIKHVFYQARGGMASHPFLTILLMIGVVFGAYWGKDRIRRSRGLSGSGGFFQLDGKEGWLSSGGPYGKAD